MYLDVLCCRSSLANLGGRQKEKHVKPKKIIEIIVVFFKPHDLLLSITINVYIKNEAIYPYEYVITCNGINISWSMNSLNIFSRFP